MIAGIRARTDVERAEKKAAADAATKAAAGAVPPAGAPPAPKK